MCVQTLRTLVDMCSKLTFIININQMYKTVSFIKNCGNSALKARDKNPALEKKPRKPLVSIISLYIYHYICNNYLRYN